MCNFSMVPQKSDTMKAVQRGSEYYFMDEQENNTPDFPLFVFFAISPWRHVPLHVDVHAVEAALHGVGRRQEEISEVPAHGGNQDDLAQRLSDAAGPRG